MSRALRARPMCAVCRRPVDSFTESQWNDRIRFTATCHGRVQHVDLDESEATGSIDFSVAFGSPPAPQLTTGEQDGQ